MSDNVIPFNGVTKLDLPVDRILEGAKGQIEGGVVLMGYTPEGSIYFASSMADGGEVLWLLEQCKIALLTVGE